MGNQEVKEVMWIKRLAPKLRIKRTDCNFQLSIRRVHLLAFGSWESSYSIHWSLIGKKELLVLEKNPIVQPYMGHTLLRLRVDQLSLLAIA